MDHQHGADAAQENPLISIAPEDQSYEEECLRNPYAIRSWLLYIEHKRRTLTEKSLHSTEQLNIIYERALKQLPGSYKLWYNYLRVRRVQLRGLPPTDAASNAVIEAVNVAFERALVFMHKMPRIWLDYCRFLTRQGKITRTRRVFDRALRSLPITQHHRVWPLYIDFINMHGSALCGTGMRVFERYVKLEPQGAEEYVEYLKKCRKMNEAAVQLVKIVNTNPKLFVLKSSKTKYELWTELCDLIAEYAVEITDINCDAIIRDGIGRFPEQKGRMWNSLAGYYIRSGMFERARDIFEEAMVSVTTVRDYDQIWQAYSEFMNNIVSTKMSSITSLANGDSTSSAAISDPEGATLEVDLWMERLTDLTDRNDLLRNSVLLRQNPHNVQEWLKRCDIYLSRDPPELAQGVTALMEGCRTVHARKACYGNLSDLWIRLAKLYENEKQLDDARKIFTRATQDVNYSRVEDLSSVYCAFAEMELRQRAPERARKVVQQATTPPSPTQQQQNNAPVADSDAALFQSVRARLHRHRPLWSLYADLEETYGTFESARAVYERIIDLKICTPQMIMNYAVFLEETNHFEASFAAYEKGISLFHWPHVESIWLTYLTKFMNRYGAGKQKIERLRDLFEQCLEKCPAEHAKKFYLLYAKLEEDHGLTRRAIAIYERATQSVRQGEMYEVYNIYIKRIAQALGLTHTRAIYQRAIEQLPDDQSREMCLRFAELEIKLGEIDRARTIYSYCSQLCDPRVAPQFWDTWRAFEVKYGNEETLREMLRIRRSVQASFNTQTNFMAKFTYNATLQAAADKMEALEASGMGQQAQSEDYSSSRPTNDENSDDEEADASRGEARPVPVVTAPPTMPKLAFQSVAFVRGREQAFTKSSEGPLVQPEAERGLSAGNKSTVQQSNPDEIQLGDDDDDDEHEEDGAAADDDMDGGNSAAEQQPPGKKLVLEQRMVPAQVFGGLRAKQTQRPGPDDD